MFRTFTWVAIACFSGFIGVAQLPQGVTVTKIWDKAPHSAFTDLIRFKGQFYCSFREGSDHVPGTDGVVRILCSKNGKEWTDLARLEEKGIDLRDPKLSISPSGQLMVTIGGSIYENGKLKGRVPYVSFSDKAGKTFSTPEKVVIDPTIVSWGDWIWRVTWHKGTGYAIDYQIGPEERRGPTAMYLVKTIDGRKYDKVAKIDLDGFPNEATVRFAQNDSMYIMIRRELEDKMGVLATSMPPYQQFDYEKMNIRLGGPNFIFDDGARMIAGTRMYEPGVYSAILVREDKGNFKELVRLPSSGDNSYPGLVIHGKYLWVSYYSSHEGKTSIYIAKIPLSLVRSKI